MKKWKILPSVDFDKAKIYGKDETVFVEIMDVQYDKERTFEVGP
jgi:hypothetical protein